MTKAPTFALYFGNRGFMPAELIESARASSEFVFKQLETLRKQEDKARTAAELENDSQRSKIEAL